MPPPRFARTASSSSPATAFPPLRRLARDYRFRGPWTRRGRRFGKWQCWWYRCYCRWLNPSDGTGKLTLCAQLELVEALFDISLKNPAGGHLRDQRDPYVHFDSYRQLRIAIYGLQHIRTSKRLEPSTGLPKLDAMRRLEHCLLDGLHRHACEVASVLHSHPIGATFKQIGGEPQTGNAGVGLQTADQLKDFFDRCPDNPLPLDANHSANIQGGADEGSCGGSLAASIRT